MVKKILVTAIIILIVLILGILAYTYWFNVSIGGEEDFEEFSFLESCLNSCKSCKQNCHDQDAWQKAELQVDESLCEDIANENLKQECIFSVVLIKAINAQDNSLCNSIVNEDQKQMCIDAVEASLNPPEIEGELE